jgi:hypothetical protein
MSKRDLADEETLVERVATVGSLLTARRAARALVDDVLEIQRSMSKAKGRIAKLAVVEGALIRLESTSFLEGFDFTDHFVFIGKGIPKITDFHEAPPVQLDVLSEGS